MFLEFGDKRVIDVVDTLWALDGTSLHYVFEKTDSSNVTELRLTVEVDGMTVSGKIDVYEVLPQRLLDYKKTSVWTHMYNPEGKEDYIAQVNVNAFLLRANGFNVVEVANVYIFRDWKKTDYLRMQNRGYPLYPIMYLKLPLWTDEQTLAYIKNRINLHKKAYMDWQLGVLNGCAPKGRWREDDVYAVLNQKRTRAVNGGANFETEAEAKLFAAKTANGGIELREGVDKRCDSYCDYTEFCTYYKKNKKALFPGLKGK